MRSPTARTLEYLRKTGIKAAVVERYNPWARKRVDVFGGDILTINGKLIQTTSGDNHSARLTKSLENIDVIEWISHANGFEVWSWRKGGPRGKRKVWTLRRTVIQYNPLSCNVEACEINDAGKLI